MTKTRNKLKIMGLMLTLVMMVSLLGMFSLTASATTGVHSHCYCGGKSCGDHNDVIEWTAWNSANSLPTAEGNYYLTKDVDMGNVQWAIPSNTTIKLCLNGYTVSIDSPTTSDYRYFSTILIYFSSLTVTDCKSPSEAGTLNLTDSENNYAIGALGDFTLTGSAKLNVKLTKNNAWTAIYYTGNYLQISKKASITCEGGSGISFAGGENADISGGTVIGSTYGIEIPRDDTPTDTVNITGGSFRGGISAINSRFIPLNGFLPEGYDFYIGNTMQVLAADALSIGGANETVSVKGSFTDCTHSNGSTTYTSADSSTQHTVTYSCCGAEVLEDHFTQKSENKATCDKKAKCDACGESYGEVDKANHDETVIYENGFCPYCDIYQPATLNESGYYEISNAGQLFWFANHINTVDRTASAVLVADIDLENRPWTPIGTTGENNKNFRGVFDGQNHTIRGLYVEGTQNGVGFFGEVRTGTVKNFTIYGEVIVNTQHDYVGGVIGSICGLNSTDHGLERNGAIIQNITSYVNLTAKAHGVGMIGGFVGYANHQSLIENCSWYGTFDAGIYRVDSGAGGFIGKIQENTSEVTIRNCAAYGTIKTNYAGDYNNTATIYMGGFLSFSNTNAQTTLENCLFAGKFERGENLTDEAFLGAFGTLQSVNMIKNCYYLGDGVLEAVHSDSHLKPGSDNVEITSVTGAQLLSGEVAYKLGEHFGQTLEGENRQSYPVLGGESVPSSRFEIYGQQLNIGGDLSMKYYVMGYAPAFNSGALYMEFSHNGVKTKVYAGEPNADNFYVFILEGINPQFMGDSIYAKLYYNKTEVASHGYDEKYSIEINLGNLLDKHKEDAALVTLIKDTLAYGEAASAYRQHQTMTGNTYTENSSNREIPVSELEHYEKDPNYPLMEQYTVNFGTTVSIKIKVSYLYTVKVYVNGKEYVTTEEDEDRGYIIFKSDPISATDFDKDFSVIIQNDQGENYSYIIVSVNDYLYAISQSTDASGEMKALAKALYNYGYSAKVYNHVVNGVYEHTTVNGICTLCNENVGYDFDEETNTYNVYEAEALQSVLNEAALHDRTVKLMRDLTVDADSYYSLLISSGTVILDLNGYKLTSVDEVAILVAEGSTLTVKDSSTSEIPGAIDALSEGIQTAGIKNQGELFVESGTIYANTFGILNDGILTISGGSVGAKNHVAILGGMLYLSGTPYLFNGSENTSGEYLGCDIACSEILVQTNLGETVYTYYDSSGVADNPHFTEFTGYGLSSDRSYFIKVN